MNKWDEQYQQRRGLRWWPNEELVRFLGRTYGDMRKLPGAGMHAVELGCGTGCNMIALTSFGFYASGHDHSEQAIDVAGEYISSWALYDNAKWGVSQHTLPNALPWATSSIDLIVDCQTIQHLDATDHGLTYREIARVLRPGGRFWSMHWMDGDADELYENQYPELRAWSIGVLGPMLDDAGLQRGGLFILKRSDMNRAQVAHGMWYIMDWVKP